MTNTYQRLPINLVIDKDDLESDDDAEAVTQQVHDAEVRRGNDKSRRKIKLASTMVSGLENVNHYVDVNPEAAPEPSKGSTSGSVDQLARRVKELNKPDDLMKKSVLKPGFEKLEAVPRYDEGRRRLKLQRRKEAEKTKGPNWFDLPATEMTEEKLRDLEVIRMRSIINPKQFYKKNDLKVVPKYFQVGQVVDSAADFYSSRVPRKERKKTLVDELMADAQFQNYNKRKYAEIITAQQATAARGAHRHAKRLKGRKK